MFFSKRLPKLSHKTRKVRCNFELDGKQSTTYLCSNVQIVGSSLCSIDLHFEQMPFESHALKVLHVTQNKTYILAQDGVYVISSGVATKIINDSRPDAIAHVYRNNMIICGKGLGIYLVNKDDTTQFLLEAGFNSLVVSSERQIGIIDYILYFNAAGESDNWQQARHTDLPTNCQAVCLAGGKVYLLGDTTYVFSPDYDDAEQSVRAIGKGLGTVQVKSMVDWDGKVIFATDKGLRALSPSGNISPIFNEIGDYVNFDGSVACRFGNKYYLSCKRKSGALTQNDITLILNPDTQQIEGVLGIGFESMLVVDDRLYVVREGNLYRSYVSTVLNSWRQEIDFGTDEIKHLQSLAIQTKYDVEVWISNGNVSRMYRVKGKKGVQRIPIRGAGRKFSVKLSTIDGMKVDYLQLTATVHSEV